MDVEFDGNISQNEVVADTKAMLTDDPNILANVGATVDPNSITATSQEPSGTSDDQLVDITWFS